ncbi:uncharacterized protein LOC131215050 [Anopheles bellator]|uniref:uncharacterized protein LOC131215050 n=1 Tax=Anopheles bellator TaxID=139047 RepID=UPI002649F50A|nr:uncharacterized protein LOC131215050 [Anopheles bellator]
MLKLVLFVGLVGLAVAYDFQDPYYNQILLEDMLEASEDSVLLGRFRRSAGDSLDEKCSRRSHKCCNDDNVENVDKIKELKRQCFAEQRLKRKEEPVDMFSCERVNKTRKDVNCAMECVGRKKNIVADDGSLLEDKVLEFAKTEIAPEEWLAPLVAGFVDTCIKEVKEKSVKSPRESGQCNPEASAFGYCMWRQISTACPKEKQIVSRRCDRIREKLANKESLHYLQAVEAVEDV